MSLFFRAGAKPEERAVSSVPWSQGGPRLGVDSLESSLSLVPVYAAIALLADEVSSLPLRAFRKTSTGREPVQLPELFESPLPYGTAFDWMQQAMTSILLRGNAYGLKVGGGLLPSSIVWLDPDRVERDDLANSWLYDGQRVADQDLLHVPGMLVPGSRVGVSPLGACRATVQAGTETQRFMKDWYANKAVPGVIAKNSEKAVIDDAPAVKERLQATMRAGEPFVTGKDWDFTFMKLSADDAGFVTASQLTATQIANIYRLPPERIGGASGASMTYKTLEQDDIRLLMSAVRPWTIRFEAAFSSLLPKLEYVKFNLDSRIRVDTRTRYDVHRTAREIGLNNIDELRALEDLPPLPDGQGEDYTPLRTSSVGANQEVPNDQQS